MPSAERVGLSSVRLAMLERVIKEKYVDSGRMPGVLCQLWRRGELAHMTAIGSMDIERGKPMRDDAIFRLHSMTKPITAAALLMLVEEGKVDLSDDVATYIPSWKDLGVFAGGTIGTFVTVPPKRPMKVIDLVTHTSGLTYGFYSHPDIDAAYRAIGVGERDTEGGLDAMIEQLSGLPLEFSPGEAWNYSVSTDVIGYLVQRISGQSFGEILRKRLFEPLGMSDTAFHCPASKLDRLTSRYNFTVDGGLILDDDPQNSVYAPPPKLESGGAGLVSTASDYMRFCRMLLGGGTLGGVQFLSPKSVALFSLNHLPQNRDIPEFNSGSQIFAEARWEGIGQSMACGVTIDVARTRLPGTVGEFGWGGAAATWFWVDPTENLAFVFMTQVTGLPEFFLLRRQLRSLVYSAFTDSSRGSGRA